jgi:hypothetical protein
MIQKNLFNENSTIVEERKHNHKYILQTNTEFFLERCCICGFYNFIKPKDVHYLFMPKKVIGNFQDIEERI